jgi:chromodomain-helicase-DNA-binding protein 1
MSTPVIPLSNGRGSPLVNSALTNDDAPYDSESDLSEVAIPIIDEPLPAPAANHLTAVDENDSDASHSSEDVQDASDDADFDIDESPAPVASNPRREASSSSSESRRPAKRKAGVDEDEHILANPELYGLRRSVRVIPCHKFIIALLTRYTAIAGASSTTSDHCK